MTTTLIRLRRPADDWQLRASCRAHPQPDLWHPSDRADRTGGGVPTAAAIAICRRCPVRLECLTATLRAESGQTGMRPTGVAGGHSGRSRHEMRRCLAGRCDHADRDDCAVPAGVVAP